MNVLNRQRVVSHLVFQVPSAHALLVFPSASLVSCFACSWKGWPDCNRFRPGMLAVTMLCSACWSSASARRDKVRHCLFLRMSGGIIPLTTGSMKVGVDRMQRVTQGDTISPKLFTATLESIFRMLNWENKGVKIDGEFLSNLRFADDILLFIETPQELQHYATRTI